MAHALVQTGGGGVANHAESGETLKGFLKERRWDKVLDSLHPGDYVIIEFGCNDSKKSGPQNIYPGQDFSETYIDAATTYKELLKKLCGGRARTRDAFPIIVSPSARRQDSAKPGSLGAYAVAAMAAAQEIGVPSIDLNSMGVDINAALGADAPKEFGDQTHHVEYGSYLQSKCIALGIQAGQIAARQIHRGATSASLTHSIPNRCRRVLICRLIRAAVGAAAPHAAMPLERSRRRIHRQRSDREVFQPMTIP
jgi:lysophospholipase L1-like esterase